MDACNSHFQARHLLELPPNVSHSFALQLAPLNQPFVSTKPNHYSRLTDPRDRSVYDLSLFECSLLPQIIPLGMLFKIRVMPIELLPEDAVAQSRTIDSYSVLVGRL